MKLKQISEDFIVNEIYDLNVFKEKNEEKRKESYYYFKLTKKDYNQIRAISLVAEGFNTSTKLVHIAGNKDKTGITSQIISVYGVKEENFEKNLEFINSNFNDLHLEFIGKFDGRINLGDNLGNSFEIVIRDLNLDDIVVLKKNFEKIKLNGVLNFFDEQRFGYANNSHIIGKYIFKNQVEMAVYEILTSIPPEPQENLKFYVEFLKENWENIKNQDRVIFDKIALIIPKFLSEQKEMIGHLMKYKNDFPGSFRKLPKKLRTLYINAYQSYVFNETIKKLDKLNLLQNYLELSLVDLTLDFDDIVKAIVLEILNKDEILVENFKLSSMPELKIYGDKRRTRNYPENLKLFDEEQDELNIGKLKIKIKFDLGSGEYATNVVKQLFF